MYCHLSWLSLSRLFHKRLRSNRSHHSKRPPFHLYLRQELVLQPGTQTLKVIKIKKKKHHQNVFLLFIRAAAAAAAAVNREKSKEWTKFVDSPTGTSGNTSNGNSGGNSLTSPGPKPVNFDFQKSAVERDPKILHPVPLRLTPEAAILASSANGNGGGGGAVPMLGDDVDVGLTVHRPLAKKPGMPALPDETVIATPKKEPPPPPPPRPYRTHTRSSSLDLNKLGSFFFFYHSFILFIKSLGMLLSSFSCKYHRDQIIAQNIHKTL